MCGQAMYIVTLGEHIGSGKAYWASTFTHWVSALGLHNGSGKALWGQYISTLGQHIWLAQWVRQAHWASTLPHWVLGWHYGWAQCFRQSIMGRYIAIGCQYIGAQKVPWASTLQHRVSTLGHGKYIRPVHSNIG